MGLQLITVLWVDCWDFGLLAELSVWDDAVNDKSGRKFGRESMLQGF